MPTKTDGGGTRSTLLRVCVSEFWIGLVRSFFAFLCLHWDDWFCRSHRALGVFLTLIQFIVETETEQLVLHSATL